MQGVSAGILWVPPTTPCESEGLGFGVLVTFIFSDIQSLGL